MEKRQLWSIITSRLFLLIALGAIIVLVTALIQGYWQKQSLSRQIDKIKQDIASYEKKHAEITDLITYLQSVEYQEKEARLKFNLKKPGEQVVVLPEQTKPDTGEQLNSSTTYLSNWQKWWNHFFNK